MRNDMNHVISIYVQNLDHETHDIPKDEAETHSLRRLFRIPGGEVKVPFDEVNSQWKSTIDTLLRIGELVSENASKWRVDEIEVGFTLSAKGELLFIAEAGADASIKIVLKPK